MSLPAPSAPSALPALSVTLLRDLAIRGLARMYRPNRGLFAFRLRPNGPDLILEGTSRRYTAIALIGLAGEDHAVQASVLGGAAARDACARLVRETTAVGSLGDTALALWAAGAVG